MDTHSNRISGKLISMWSACTMAVMAEGFECELSVLAVEKGIPLEADQLEGSECVGGIEKSPKKVKTVGLINCVCRVKRNDGRGMVECEKCLRWLHIRCVGLTERTAQQAKFVCQGCKAGGGGGRKRKRKASGRVGIAQDGVEGVRKRVQDGVVGKVVDLVKVEGWVAGSFVEGKVKEVYVCCGEEREGGEGYKSGVFGEGVGW